MNKNILIILLFGLMVPLLLMGYNTVGALAQGPTPIPVATQIPPTPLPQQFMFNFKVEDVTKFQVTGQGKTVAFTRLPDGVWHADPRDYAPYEKNITVTLQNLSQLQGGVVVGGAPDIQPYGLHAPTIVATMIVSGGVEIPLNVGKPDPDHASYYYASNFPHTTPVYSIPGVIVDELKGYLNRPAASPTPTKPTPSPSPSSTATATATAAQTPTLAPSPTPPTQTIVVSLPPILTPSPTSTPTPVPSPAPPPNFVEMLIQRAKENPLVAVGGSGVCLVVLLAFAAFVIWLLRKLRTRQPPPVPPPPSAFLEGVTIPGLELRLTRENMTLGRAPECDLPIPEDAQAADTISRYHARFEKRGERWAVIDGVEEGKLSTNGVYVNGKRTLENYLTENDEISFGEVKFRFHAQPVNAYPSAGGQP